MGASSADRNSTEFGNVNIPEPVSRVINDSGYVRASIRAAVQAAIEELHYVPNVNARVLKTKQTPQSDRLLGRLADQRLPLVLVGRSLDHPFVDSVSANDRRGVRGRQPPHGASPRYSPQLTGYQGAQEILRLRSRPTAIFARNDHTAIGALQALKGAGLRIPEDVSIAGFDNVPLSAAISPPLTTVSQPHG